MVLVPKLPPVDRGDDVERLQRGDRREGGDRDDRGPDVRQVTL